MKITRNSLKGGVIPTAQRIKTHSIEQQRKGVLDQFLKAVELYKAGKKSRAILEFNGITYISIFHSTKRLIVTDDGSKAVVVDDRNALLPTCEFMAQEIRDGYYDDQIKASSAVRVESARKRAEREAADRTAA